MPVTDHSIQVSILLAARNEEANIKRCLESLDKLNFPEQHMEVWIGDDDSTDNTAAVILEFIKYKPHFKYQKITEHFSGLKGKANVLAQLARKAEGKYFFFCDADIAVPETWINGMLRHFQAKTGIVVGLTRMRHAHLFADFLSLEWLFALTFMRMASFFNVPITGMGNNMAVTKEAYRAIGGYEKLGFSIVEDYTLFMAIVTKDYDFNMAYSEELLSVSEPLHTFGEFIVQRKRWMRGVMESFWVTRFFLILSVCFVPFTLIMAIWFPVLSLITLVVHYLILTGMSMLSIAVLRQKDLWGAVFIFWFYMVGNTTLMLINYILPGKMVWKGREYA